MCWTSQEQIARFLRGTNAPYIPCVSDRTRRYSHERQNMQKTTGGLGANAEVLAPKNRKREDWVVFRLKPGPGNLLPQANSRHCRSSMASDEHDYRCEQKAPWHQRCCTHPCIAVRERCKLWVKDHLVGYKLRSKRLPSDIGVPIAKRKGPACKAALSGKTGLGSCSRKTV
jgi:hypothetical protein